MSNKQQDVTPKMLKRLLRYEPETGELFWNPRDPDLFKPATYFKSGRQTAANQWNARHAGKQAFTATEVQGYRIGRIMGYTFKAHRVIWAIVHGEWPENQIDHINGVRSDNRLINLRVVTGQENTQNRARRSDNTSGVTGVSWDKKSGRWRADICCSGETRNLGFFATIEEAAQARNIAATEAGFHPNHGRAAQ